MATRAGALQRKRTISEHGQHGWIIDRLWALSMTPESALQARRWRRLLRAEIRELLAILTARFEEEEEGGYMTHISGARPEWDAQLASLYQQHFAILSGLHAVEVAIQARLDIPVCQQRLREVLSLLHAHEHGESELAQEFLGWREGAMALAEEHNGR